MGGAEGEVYCSGVHHFCMHDRSFATGSPEFGLHDDSSGCSHPDCCLASDSMVVLHLDSPSFEDWRAKFSIRASSSLTEDDQDEMVTLPFKQESVEVLRRSCPSRDEEEEIYRRWRCLPGRPLEHFHPTLSGECVAQRFVRALQA